MSFRILDVNYSLLPKEIFFTNWKNYYQDFHIHEEGCLEIDYIVDGSCIYHLNNHEIQLNRRSMLIHNGNSPHDYHVPDSCLNMSILCCQKPITPNAGSFSDLLAAFPYIKGFFNRLENGIVLRNAGSMYSLAKEINNSFHSSSGDMYLNLLLNKFLIDSINASYFQSPARIYTEQIREYINYHYFSIQSIEEIAKELSLNKIYMERIFKQETGTSIWSYLNDIRMQKAAYYLSLPDVPIGSIDELIGIHSRQNFYLLFKKKYQISPSGYRRMLKERKLTQS